MRVTYIVSKQEPPPGSRRVGTDPRFPDAGGGRREATPAPLPVPTPGRMKGEPRRHEADADAPAPAMTAGRAPGLSSPDPRHPSFTAISWVVLQEVKHDAAMALLRLELLRRQHPAGAIARATEFLRCAVGELDALAAGESDEDDAPARD
jgi:hypothetical protein